MTKEHILKEINILFERLFNIVPEHHGIKYMDEQLLGPKFRLTSRDLAYIYVEVENIFDIQISQEALLDIGFNTISNVVEVVLASYEVSMKEIAASNSESLS